MSIKASLKVQLLANDVIVAESEDSLLWNSVFSAISSGGNTLKEKHGERIGEEEGNDSSKGGDSGDAIDKFAAELGVDRSQLVGACSPSDESPYLHLDDHYWESLRKNTGSRGKNAVGYISFAVTLLAIWSKHRDHGDPIPARDGQNVLGTIHLSDKNPTRALRNCEWLQQRGTGWVINPAKRSMAVKLAKAYVLQQPVSEV